MILDTKGSVPERPKGADCKSVVTDFGGPNPPAPTKKLSNPIGLLNFLSNPKDWYVINGQSPLDGIATKERMASRIGVYSPSPSD